MPSAKSLEAVLVEGSTSAEFNAFLRHHESFLRHKFAHLIGKPLYFGCGQREQPLGIINAVTLGDSSAVSTNDTRFRRRVFLCSSEVDTDPYMMRNATGIVGYLPHIVSTPCKLLGHTRVQYTSQPADLCIPKVIWALIQKYEGPRSWTCSTSDELVPLDAWFGLVIFSGHLSCQICKPHGSNKSLWTFWCSRFKCGIFDGLA